MGNQNVYQDQYPIVLERKNSSLYKKLSFLFVFLSIIASMVLIVMVLVYGISNPIEKIFGSTIYIIVPVILIAALAAFGNRDEIITISIDGNGFDIKYSNYSKSDQKFTWRDIRKIELSDGEHSGIAVYGHSATFFGFFLDRKIIQFSEYGSHDLCSILVWHWKKNAFPSAEQ